MFVLFSFIVCFFVVKGFVVLDEETLIILASFVWVDAAGGFIRKALEAELVHKGDVIRDKFFWFLNRKRDIGEELVKFYKSRESIQNLFLNLHSFYIREILAHTVKYFYAGKLFLDQMERESLVFAKNDSLPKAYLANRLYNFSTIYHKSGSDIIYLNNTNNNFKVGF